MPLTRGVTSNRNDDNRFQGIPGGAESDYEDDELLGEYYDNDTTTLSQPVLSNRHTTTVYPNQPIQGTDVLYNTTAAINMESDRYSEGQINEFYFAIIREEVPIVKQVIEGGMPVDILLRNGWNALLLSCYRGVDELVELLLEKGANPNFHKDGFSALMTACSTNAKEELELFDCVKHLVKHGADLNAKTSSGLTALMFCAREGKKLILDYLMESGAKADVTNKEGWSALHYAINSGYEVIVQSLLMHNPKLATVKIGGNGDDIVMFSTKKGQLDLASTLEAYLKSETLVIAPKTEQNTNILHPLQRPFTLQDKIKKSSYDQIDIFLNGLDLKYLTPIFHTNAIEFSQLLLLTDDDLIKMGIDKLAERLKIMEGIRAIHKKEWENASVQQVKSSKLTCPESVAIVENIDQHLKHVRSTIKFMHRAIKENPKILEKEQDVKNINQLIEQVEKTATSTTNLSKSLKKFQLHLGKVCDYVEYRPANLIVAKPAVTSSKMSFRKITAIATTVAVMALCASYVASYLTK